MRKKTFVLSAAVLMAAALPARPTVAQPAARASALEIGKRPPAGRYVWDAGRKRWVYTTRVTPRHSAKDAWWNRHRDGANRKSERAWFRSRSHAAEFHRKHHKHHPRGNAYGHYKEHGHWKN